MEKPKWIVNNKGELGVLINGRCFFMYKGEDLEYQTLCENSPTQYRFVGKREFGESGPISPLYKKFCGGEELFYHGDWFPLPDTSNGIIDV